MDEFFVTIGFDCVEVDWLTFLFSGMESRPEFFCCLEIPRLFFVTGWIGLGLGWNPVLFSSLCDWIFLSQNCAFGYGMISDLL